MLKGKGKYDRDIDYKSLGMSYAEKVLHNTKFQIDDLPALKKNRGYKKLEEWQRKEVRETVLNYTKWWLLSAGYSQSVIYKNLGI